MTDHESRTYYSSQPAHWNAITELEGLITSRYPEAIFEVSRGRDPEGVYLTATVDTDDLTSVLDAVGDRLVDMQVERGLPPYVVASRPLARVLDELRRPRPRSRPRIDWSAVTLPSRP